MALIYRKNTLPKNQFFNCKATFKAAGITSKVHINERGDAVELAHFDLINCTKVRHYSQEQILCLAKCGVPLTINQQKLLQKYCQERRMQKRSRLPLLYFPNKDLKE